MVGCQPREAFVEPVSRRGTGRLHVPVAVADPGQTELLLDLVRLHGYTPHQPPQRKRRNRNIDLMGGKVRGESGISNGLDDYRRPLGNKY